MFSRGPPADLPSTGVPPIDRFGDGVQVAVVDAAGVDLADEFVEQRDPGPPPRRAPRPRRAIVSTPDRPVHNIVTSALIRSWIEAGIADDGRDGEGRVVPVQALLELVSRAPRENAGR